MEPGRLHGGLGPGLETGSASEVPEASWLSSAAYAGAQVLAVERHLKTTIKSEFFRGFPL
jgi:hypothetical protein